MVLEKVDEQFVPHDINHGQLSERFVGLADQIGVTWVEEASEIGASDAESVAIPILKLFETDLPAAIHVDNIPIAPDLRHVHFALRSFHQAREQRQELVRLDEARLIIVEIIKDPVNLLNVADQLPAFPGSQLPPLNLIF